MIVQFSSDGNHSNRLFQTIHFEAFAKKFDKVFYNPTFADIAIYYGIRSNCFDKSFIRIIKFLSRKKLLKIHHYTDEFENDYSSKAVILTKGIHLVTGFGFRVEDLTLKYKIFFQQKYTVSELVIDKYLNDKSSNLRNILKKIDDSEVCIGVHIRKGDYKYWLNGAHYYDDSVYFSAIEAIKVLFLEKKVFFVIFSNETVTMTLLEDMIVSNNEWYIDHHIMSKCDYLIGPPSTFTMWASYISSKAKYYHMKDTTDFPTDISDFQDCNG